MIAAAAHIHGPHIDWAGISSLVALLGGAVVVLLAGLLRPRTIRTVWVPILTLVALGAALGLSIWQWDEHHRLVAGAIELDDLGLSITMIVLVAAMTTVLLSWRSSAPVQASHGEYYALLLTSVAGMVVLAQAINTVTVFVGFELLSIPLYVLCATEMVLRRPVPERIQSITMQIGLAIVGGMMLLAVYNDLTRLFFSAG